MFCRAINLTEGPGWVTFCASFLGLMVTNDHRMGGFKQQKCIVPQSWRLGNQGVNRVGSFWKL